MTKKYDFGTVKRGKFYLTNKIDAFRNKKMMGDLENEIAKIMPEEIIIPKRLSPEMQEFLKDTLVFFLTYWSPKYNNYKIISLGEFLHSRSELYRGQLGYEGTPERGYYYKIRDGGKIDDKE
jgi:hypothetical protein